jgi:4-aminobutyrate aminotransferase-like enzyme
MDGLSGMSSTASTNGTSFLARGDFVYRHPEVPTFVSAEGAILEDAEGRRYLDAEAANGTANLGFDSSIIHSAVTRLGGLPGLPSFCESALRLSVAERIARMMHEATGLPGRVAFELGGAQGVELATKVVRSNSSCAQLVVFEGGYHGRSPFVSQLSGSDRYRRLNGGWRIPVYRLPYPDFEQGPFASDPAEALRVALFELDRLTTLEVEGLADGNGNHDVAALIVEPILNAGGIVRPAKKYFETLVSRFRDMGALIVIDEVFCGFHRTGPMWGFEHYDFRPDIVIGSKALTNGIVPLAFVWGRDPLMDEQHFRPGSHSATYQTTQVGLAVAAEVLDRYEAWQQPAHSLGLLEAALRSAVCNVVERHALARSSWTSGGLARILLSRPIAGRLLDRARSVARDAPVDGVHGLILASTGMAQNVVAINPPLTIRTDELTILSELLDRTFASVDT